MRASDRDRERALAALRAGCAEGYLSIDTFERRVELTLAARSAAELRRLVADVGRARPRVPPLRRPRRRAAQGAIAIAPPAGDTVVVGRSSGCDIVLEDPTVSRRHLELRPAGDGRWLAVDVGSLNGTWLVDRRVGRVTVRSGDELWLGSCPVRLT
ncbi:MAG TPA: DUF1707 and FHA domain-containing protein [Solirubrobacteraceae bacterium]|nr:DUF1707 and FHA domain-containing protein [Solirubrobacteraceae bacterium]